MSASRVKQLSRISLGDWVMTTRCRRSCLHSHPAATGNKRSVPFHSWKQTPARFEELPESRLVLSANFEVFT